MGNRMMCGSLRRPVEERLTRPQRLARQPSDVDYKKLRKLILSRKLAPCFDGLDDPRLDAGDLEECPICFLYYPSLNRSRCCGKGICTECFLQMKPSDTTRTARCPFCKSHCYAVEYRGARTEEEKDLQEAEEQKVIEAKIRMQCESENVRQVMLADQIQPLEVRSPISNLEGLSSGLGDCSGTANSGAPLMGESFEADGSSVPHTCSTRHEEFAVDFEEIMMMEAIWQSLQDARLQKWKINQTCGSSNKVGLDSGAHESNNIGTFFASSSEGEYSSPDSLAEHNFLPQQISESNYHRSQTDQDPSGDSFEESDGTGSETECFANFSNSDEDTISEPIDPGCRGSINVPSTSNASLGSLLCLNGGQGCSQISGLVMAEQTFMLAAESKA